MFLHLVAGLFEANANFLGFFIIQECPVKVALKAQLEKIHAQTQKCCIFREQLHHFDVSIAANTVTTEEFLGTHTKSVEDCRMCFCPLLTEKV